MVQPKNANPIPFTRAVQWTFFALLVLWLFGNWMDSYREGVDWRFRHTLSFAWFAFIVLIVTIEGAVSRILHALVAGAVAWAWPGRLCRGRRSW